MPDNEGVYAIAQWERFENCRTREVKYMSWISLPVAFDSDSIGFLMSKPNGLRNFGLFVGLIQIAANMPVRGVLKDSKGPLTPKRLAMMLRCSEAEVAEGLAVLSDPDVGLISRSCTTSHDIAQIPCLSVVSVCPVVSVPENEQPPNIKQATGSADRFLANRTIATGNAPPGFVAFYNAYPTGYKSDHDGLLALWNGQGLEERSANIIDGLKQWLACERWQQGFVVEAKKFIETRKWRDTPPPPKPVTDRHGKPVTPPKPGPEKLDTAGQAAFKAWWRALDPGGQAAFAQAKGVAVSVVNENVNWQRVPAAWGDAIGEGKQRSTA